MSAADSGNISVRCFFLIYLHIILSFVYHPFIVSTMNMEFWWTPDVWKLSDTQQTQGRLLHIIEWSLIAPRSHLAS